MSDLPKFVRINEEGPREGFQIEGAGIPTARKIELIDRLSATGLRQIQVASFVNPRRVTGMADADEVVAGFTRHPGVRYTGLWLNEKGFARALASGRLDLLGRIVLCASDVFLARNAGMTAEGNIASHRLQIAMYRAAGIPVAHGGIQAAFGCNFQGEITVAHVLKTAADVFMLADEAGHRLETFVLADTMAWANPTSIRRMVGAFRDRYPDVEVILHLHDTRGLGVANGLAGLMAGVTAYDTSIAGLGGCPFAEHRGAAGNLCTEDFAFMCAEMGIETGVDLEALIDAARFATEVVGHPLPGSVKEGGSLDRLRRIADASTKQESTT
jgi:hydroxymethylglutaryl-CoA lyase